MRVTLVELWGREGMLHYASRLANHLARLPDVQATVLLPRGSDVGLFEPGVTVDFVDVVRDATPRELLSVPWKLLQLRRFFETIRQTEPDLLHLNNCHVWYLFTLPWLRRRYPIVSTLHDVRPHPGRDDTWRKRREIDTVARLSHRIFVHGQTLKRELLAEYPSRLGDEVTVIPLGDFSFLTEVGNDVAEENADLDPPTVLWFGRIRHYKGLEYLLEAAPLVAQRMPGVRFLIAGAGDFQPYRKLLSPGVDFEIHNCYIPDNEIATYFRRSSIVALPYTEASQSGIVSIAYAFGKPVVATRVGCLPDVVEDGKTGLLVPSRDAATLAEAMLSLLKNDGLRKALGQNAQRKMKEELGWDKIAATTQSVYRAVVQEFGAAS